MARDFNSVVLTGRATRDTEVKTSQGGMSYATIGFACTTTEKRGEEYEEKPMYLDVKVFGKTADFAGQYVTKGKSILVSGELVLDTWEKDGQKHSKHILKANVVNLNGPPPSQDSEGEDKPARRPQKTKAKSENFATGEQNEEIPF